MYKSIFSENKGGTSFRYEKIMEILLILNIQDKKTMKVMVFEIIFLFIQLIIRIFFLLTVYRNPYNTPLGVSNLTNLFTYNLKRKLNIYLFDFFYLILNRFN